MKITKRQGEILNKIVQEYIELAQPISSQLLERKYDFGICPATIRIEMQKLTKMGFLFQPHTSAGRIPTDKGYRFFVDGLFEEKMPEIEIEDWFKSEISDTIKFIQKLTENLALSSSSLALSYLVKGKIFWKEGWEEILKKPECRKENFVFNFAEFLESFEKNIENLKLNSEIKIYIGRESPFKKAKDFSIIVSKCNLPEDGEGIIALLGPKRMTYDKNISLIREIIKTLERL